ncbi:hypothetical protein DAPPUDRAFT_108078 [Daphnia pulex]|uniref:Uncharacterized protein n=1 Tax=Daphnia pulex TaxID=6669 RepID=E9GZ35_DAPPU|nr:hypothetical protein DAPPUDRAFT_108078 [Daphnia pulex]|eukprot:EFX75300.1 hypothetical protein DAPPUDRAFT_108078 [Daphnia pulex]
MYALSVNRRNEGQLLTKTDVTNLHVTPSSSNVCESASSRTNTEHQEQKNVITKPAEKPSVKGKALAPKLIAPPVLSLSSRATLIEQRLTQLEQDNDWWINWKKDQHVKLVGHVKHTAGRSEDDSSEEDLVEHFENSLNL